MKSLYQYRALALLVVLLVTLAVAGCGGNSDSTNGTVRPTDKPDPGVVTATNGFGLNLFQKLAAAKPSDNVFFSPTSISLALAMAFNGAAGDTKTAMQTAMGLADMSTDTINNAYLSMRNSLKLPETEAQLDIANAIWTAQGLTFKPAFLRTNHDFYGADVAALDFAGPTAADTINNWASDKTQGKITNLVNAGEVRDLTMFLVNAVYLKGKWTVPFEVAATAPGTFQSAPGGPVPMPLMYREGTFQYAETDGVQVVELPYGRGRLSMVVALPKATANLADFTKSITAARWQEWLNNLDDHAGELRLPRFKIAFEAMLNDELKDLGMSAAFDPATANFSGMIDSKMWIGFVKHKTFLKVYEAGTQAAAATGIGMPGMAAPPDNKFTMIVDHPFFCAIHDTETGAILFAGLIKAPEAIPAETPAN